MQKNTLFIALIFFLVPSLGFAAPLYAPGETLNPACLPTNPDCTVSTVSLSTANVWTALQRFTNATSSILSAYTAYFGGTATSSFSSNGSLTIPTNFTLGGSFLDSLSSAGTSGMVLQTTGSATRWVATSSLGISGGGSGSGTVGSGTTGQFPYYAANGTTLSATSTIFLGTNGNVGIGSTTPFAKLSVSSASQQSGTLPLFTVASTTNAGLFTVLGNGKSIFTPSSDGQDTLRVNTASGVSAVQLGTFPGFPAYGGFWAGNVTPSATNFTFIGDGISESIFNVPTGGSIRFRINQVNSPDAMKLNATGLSIGTNSGASKLSVSGNTGIGSTYSDIAAPTNGLIVEGNVGIGTTSPFTKLGVAGDTYLGGNLTATGTVSFTNTNGQTTIASELLLTKQYPLRLNNNVELTGQAGNGILTLYDGSIGDFNRIQLGGSTAAFPSIKRNGANLDFRLADDSGYATTTAQGGIFNGYVGIGTSSPFTKLGVAGDTYLGGNLTATGTLSIGNTVTGTKPSIYSTGPYGDLNIESTQNQPLYLRAPGNMSFMVGGVYKAVLDSNGLGVNCGSGGSSVATFRVCSGNATVGDYGGGNFGVGTTTPFARLSIGGDTYLGGNLTATGTLLVGSQNDTRTHILSNFSIVNGNSNDVNIGFTGTRGIGFAAGFAGARMTSDGILGWTSGTAFNVAPDTGISRLSAGKLAVGNGTAGDVSGTLIAGNIGIASSTPWKTLGVTGTVAFDGLTNNGTANYVCITANKEITYSTTACAGVSSQIYKHNISTLSSGLTDVLGLRPVSFVYNSDIAPNDQTTHLGFIAEEVNAINPQLVAFDEKGVIRSVKYDEFVPVLTKAIQELSAQLSELKLATSTPAAAQDSIWSYLLSKFSLAGITITDAYTSITNLRVGTLSVENELCADDVCVTKDQLKALLIQAGGTTRIVTPAPSPAASEVIITQVSTSTPETEMSTTTPVVQEGTLPPENPVATSTASVAPEEPQVTEPVVTLDPVVPPAESTPAPTPETP